MDSFPGISIVICTHNGSSRLHPTLMALTRLKVDFSWEVVIVNNSSSDDTEEMVKEFFDTQKVQIRWQIVEEAIPGLVHARFTGVSAAKYEYVLFCDDDNWLFPDYLQNASEILSENPRIGVLGGKGIAVFEAEKPDWFDKYSSSFAVGDQNMYLGSSSNELGYIYGAGSVFKKVILKELLDSGFQLALTGRKGNTLISGDDVELCYLAQLKGYKLHYSGGMEFYHWMAKNRMEWGYYLRLKEGITSSSASLFAYKYFFNHRESGVLKFSFALSKELILSMLIYLKNIIKPPKDIINKDLSIRILKMKQITFWRDYFRALTHFKQLKRHF